MAEIVKQFLKVQNFNNWTDDKKNEVNEKGQIVFVPGETRKQDGVVDINTIYANGQTFGDGAWTNKTILKEGFKVMGVTVGNLKDGDTIASGLTIEDILKKILMKTIDVKATNPSGSLKFGEANAASKTVEMGSTFTTTLGNTFIDGKFTGNSGYNYTLAAGCTQTGVVFYDGSTTVEANYSKVIKSTTTLKAVVSYSANANTPKKNNGENSGVTIAAGSFTTAAATITPMYYTFYKTFASGAVENAPVSSAQNNGYTISFTNPSRFDIANSNSIAKIVIYTRSEIKDVKYITPVMGQPWAPEVTSGKVILLPNGDEQNDYKKYVIATADGSNFAGGGGCYISITY